MEYALCFFRQGKVGSENDQKPWWRVLVQVPGEGWGSPSQTAHRAESPAGEQCLGLQWASANNCRASAGQRTAAPEGARGAPDCAQPSPARQR